jgi:ABC-type nickel/cobalt efflux system permease component RcnA
VDLKEVALVLAVSIGISLNVVVLGLIWLCWRAVKSRPPDTFEGVSRTPTFTEKTTEQWPAAERP